MPLRDHFHPPLSDRRHWEGFHAQWAAILVQHLARRLPPRYYAEPHVHLSVEVEADVATFEEEAAAAPTTGSGDGVATAGEQWQLETWPEPLTLGAPLPTLPLWLASNLAVPLELEPTYEETCRVLRIG